MKELFLNVLTASMHGSVIIGVILLLRPFLKRAPKNMLCLLWLLAALRLLLPFEIRSSLSLQPDLEGINLPGSEYAEQMTSGFQSSTQDVILPPVEWEDVPVQTPDTEITRQPVENTVIYEVDVPLKVKILENYEQIVALLWMAGAAGLMIYSAVAYLLLKRKVRDSVVYADGVWVCGSLESAFVLGFFRPQIYLSAGLPENAREYVLVHERTHIRRGDHWWKLLGYLTLALHWFNPLVWLAYSLLCRDLEMACDEAVVKTMSVAERKTYSAALLACSVRGARIAACPVAFGEVSVKQRIKNVLHYRKPAFWITIVALVLVAVIAVCFLTSPENAPDLSFLNYENAISTVADQDQVMTIYCDEDSIIPCQVDGSALAKYLDNANWKQRRWEPGDQSSPGSIEFIISDDYRITVFDRNFARVKYNGDTRYYRISRSDYEQALELIDDAKYAELTWNLEVKAADVTPSGLTFTFIQHGPFAEGDRASLMYGSEYTLQVRNGQNWDDVPFVHHDYEIAWTTEAYLIEIGKTYQQRIDWQWIYGTLSAGEYRIGKTVSLDRASGDSDRHTFWAEFTIPEQSQEELIQRCRDAMIKLQKAEVGYRHTVNMTDPNRVINTCLYDSQYWCFQYRRPGWDYQDVIWLTYEDKTYSFEGDTDPYGTMSAIHYWKPDEDADKKPFVVYPLNLDWKTIPLNYLESRTDAQGQTVTLEYPHYNPFTFCFDSEGELLWYEIGDSSGEAEATTTRTYVQYPGESISDHLRGLYSEALNTVNENELVYTDGFYQSIFTPESSPPNAAELFYGFYQNPQRFIDRLAAAEKVNPSVSAQVIECMGKAVNNYAPYLFQYTLNQFPDTFYPEILGGLKAIFGEPEQENPDTDNQKKLTREEIWNLCVNAYEELRRWPTYRVCLSTAGDPNYSFHHIYGENYYIDSAVELGYDKLMYQGKLYFRVAPSYMDNKEIPSGWMSENWAKSRYPGVFDGTREQFFWESRDWDSLGLVLRTWKQEDNGLTVKFTEKADEHHEWTFTLNPFGTLTCIRASRDERMEKQWDIQLYERMAIDKPRIMYASAYRESPDAVIVRDQAFYEELFTRVTDGAYTTMWISHLFEALYAQPEEFVRQLSRKYYEDSELVKDVLKSMSYETQWYEPERFNRVVEDLRKVQNLDQSVLNLMVEYLQVK